MAPPLKSLSPSQTPPWINEILAELQRVQHQIRNQAASIHELRGICLANHQAIPQTSTSGISNPVPARPSRSTQRNTINIVNPTCWYHRQFGRAAGNCIPPCDFTSVTPIFPLARKPKPKLVQLNGNHSHQNPVKSAEENQPPVPMETSEKLVPSAHVSRNLPTANSLSDSSDSDSDSKIKPTSWRKL